jgi:ERCC4-related helicase
LSSLALPYQFQNLFSDTLRQVRPGRNKLRQVGVFLQDFVQAGGQDRILVFCKCFITSSLLIFAKGFESPWGYFEKSGG